MFKCSHLLTKGYRVFIMGTMTSTVSMVEQIGGQTVTARKDRERLTVYIDSPIFKRFKLDADSQYRSLSDHMNAILADYYGKQDEVRAVAAKRNGGSSK